MSTDRNPDRIVRAWLESMPDQAPDRAIDAVRMAVEATPQVRRPFLRGPRRLPDMNRLFVIAAVVALGAAAFGGALLVGSRGTAPVSTAPAAVLTASPASTPVSSQSIPTALQNVWIGEPRDVPGLGTSVRTALKFTEFGFGLTGTDYGLVSRMGSSVEADGTTLALTATIGGDGCNVGDVGTYPYSISTGGKVLTVQLGTDQCAARSVAVVGTWHRVLCTDAADACLGDLEAGVNLSQYIDPRLPIGATWAPAYGAITYTVPDGWSNSSDWPNTFSLTPTPDYRLEAADGPPNGNVHDVFLFTQPRAAVQDGTCGPAVDHAVGHTVNALLDWLRRQPPVAMTTATPISIDGNAGQMVDIQLSNSWTNHCPGAPEPSAVFFTQAGDRDNPYAVGMDGKARMRLILLDLGDDNVLGIAIDSKDPDRFAELATAAMPIIEWIHLK
jgi:hypothetical protein